MDPSVVIAGLLGLLGATWSALIAGFYRGDFVPGHVYRRALAREDIQQTINDRNTKAIESMARSRQTKLNASGR